MTRAQRKAFANGGSVPTSAFWRVEGEYKYTSIPHEEWKPFILVVETRSNARMAIWERQTEKSDWIYRNLRIVRPTS